MKRLTFDAPTNKTVGTQSVEVLTADQRRVFCEIINTHATNKVYLAFGANDAVLNKGTCLLPNGGSVRMEPKYFNCRQRISAIASDADTVLAISIGR